MDPLPCDLTVIMYHYVRDAGDAAEAGTGIPGLPTAAFEAQLDLLAREYEIVDWPAVRAHLMGRQPLPANACLLTFDDGLSDHYLNVFPRLSDRGLAGLFFALARPVGARLTLPHQLHFLLARLGLARLQAELAAALDPAPRQRLREATARYLVGAKAFALNHLTDAFKAAVQRELLAEAGPALAQLFAEHIGDECKAAERYYLAPAQAAEMAAGGMHFGGHSQTHAWLDFLDDGGLAREAAASAAWLGHVGPGPFAFAYPYGGYDDRTPAALVAHGFCAAFTTQAGVRHTSAFHIHRLDGECLPPAGEADAEWLRRGRAHA